MDSFEGSELGEGEVMEDGYEMEIDLTSWVNGALLCMYGDWGGISNRQSETLLYGVHLSVAVLS